MNEQMKNANPPEGQNSAPTAAQSAAQTRIFESKKLPNEIANFRLNMYQQRKRTDKYCTSFMPTVQEFADKLAVPVVSAVSYEEFRHMTRTQQVDEKDVGGFILAQLDRGIRNKHTVSNLCGIALDADYADDQFEMAMQMMELCYGYLAIVYSTRKHTPQKPRYRIIIPFSRTVTPEEHSAVGRKLAESIVSDLHYFDKTTFEANRMMFYPSINHDSEYVFKVYGHCLCDPDKVLAMYEDWHDITQWPQAPDEKEIISGNHGKLSDPLEKDGLIGAFNNAYTIQDILDDLAPDLYEQAANGRYTYRQADSVAGVVIYNNRWFYSFHASDPLSYEALNAYDLARKLLFGKKDEEAHGNTKTSNLPSHKAMLEYAKKDPKVREMLSEMKQRRARMDFRAVGMDDANLSTNSDTTSSDANSGVDTADAVCTAKQQDGGVDRAGDDVEVTVDNSWKQSLEYDNYGNLKGNMFNIMLIHHNDPTLRSISYNALSDLLEFRPAPEKGIQDVPWKHPGGIWRDADDSQLITYLELNYGSFPERIYRNALAKVADDRSYHPVLDYLDALPKWDGIPRVDRLLVLCLGAEDSAYTRAVTRKTLVGAVARVKEPGIKFDTMLVLAGPQGTGKSTIVARLGKTWFNDSLTLTDAKEKAGAEKMQGYWLMEIGELAGMRKADLELLKGFLSRQNDIFRPAFGRRATPHPRQCIFIGTTNAEHGFLRDVTGNRRFWPVKVPGYDKNFKLTGDPNSTSATNSITAEGANAGIDCANAGINDAATASNTNLVGEVGREGVGADDIATDNTNMNETLMKVLHKPSWKLTAEDVDQIWAEALHYYYAGESLVLPAELEDEAKANQKASMETDDREAMLAEYLEMLLPENWGEMDINRRINFITGGTFDGQKLVGTVRREYVTNQEIWCECFGKNRADLKRQESNQIIAMMERIRGWRRSDKKVRVKQYGVIQGYERE